MHVAQQQHTRSPECFSKIFSVESGLFNSRFCAAASLANFPETGWNAAACDLEACKAALKPVAAISGAGPAS